MGNQEDGMRTVKEVKAAVRSIKACERDYEAAHAREDELYREVLKSIAKGTCRDPSALAREALKAWELDFPGYCA